MAHINRVHTRHRFHLQNSTATRWTSEAALTGAAILFLIAAHMDSGRLGIISLTLAAYAVGVMSFANMPFLSTNEAESFELTIMRPAALFLGTIFFWFSWKVACSPLALEQAAVAAVTLLLGSGMAAWYAAALWDERQLLRPLPVPVIA